MKKKLFGLFALSTMAMAAAPGNPGAGDSASVPVKVMAEIITAPTGLVITDEAGTVLDELLLDHGQIIKGMATDDAKVQSVFKVKRYSHAGAVVTEEDLGSESKNKLTVTLGASGTATLYKGGDSSSANTPDVTTQMTSTLSLSGGTNQTSLTEYSQHLAAGDKEHMGRVMSTIPKATLNTANLSSGLYHNQGTNTLTVTIAAPSAR